MLIDSHHHLWKYSADQYGWISDEMVELRRDFWSEDLSQISADFGVDGFVSVQARQSLEETDALLELAKIQPLIHGVVGWVDFRSDEIEEQLERYADCNKLKGLRHVVQDEADDFILGESFNRGMTHLIGRGLVYDVLIFARQLSHSIQFVKNHPQISMVLDHIAKPAVTAASVDPTWAREMRELAELPNIVCKFSGVATEVQDEHWDIDTIRPYWDVALEAFSPSRLMFGSDWPVCLLRTEYKRWLDTIKELASELSHDEQQQILGGTAKRIYHLEPTS